MTAAAVIAAASSWEPDWDTFQAGAEMGVYAALMALAALVVIAFVRRLLAV